MAKKHLIIGCGTAALSAAKKIRSISREDKIKLVTAEECLPYSPAALPYLLSGRLQEDNLWAADDHLLQAWGCNLVQGKEVVGINTDRKKVVYQDGGEESYDTLLIASGSQPVRPLIKGLDDVALASFHNITDWRELAKKLVGNKEIAIYGGGMVALEIAAALLERGFMVRIIVRSRIARGYFAEEVGTFIESVLRLQGAEIHAGSEIDEVRIIEDGTEIVLSTGPALHTDLLIACTGVEPRIAFLQNTGIAINHGILVDKHMSTNLTAIYAAGDAVEACNFFSGRPDINAITPSAIQQGRIAGANMAGEKDEDKGWIPMNLFRFFGHTFFCIGLLPWPSCEVITLKDDLSPIYKELVFQENRLVGARFVDVDIDPGIIRYLIEERVDIGGWQEQLATHPQEVGRSLMLRSERN